MEYTEQVNEIAQTIKKSKNFFVLTGAGISTESGIPDFRSPGTGIWEKTDPIKTSSTQVLKRNPKLFFEVGFARFASLKQAQPNPGHFALAQMEERGYMKGLITQNIDGLHVKAGSKNVWEVHGHLRTCHCMGCKKPYDFEEISSQLKEGQNPPRCTDCHQILRPDVVLFGDAMTETFFAAEGRLRQGCDFLLVVGSSLVVYPVAGLPGLADALSIINLQPTSYDYRAQVVVREKCSKALQDILAAL